MGFFPQDLIFVDTCKFYVNYRHAEHRDNICKAPRDWVKKPSDERDRITGGAYLHNMLVRGSNHALELRFGDKCGQVDKASWELLAVQEEDTCPILKQIVEALDPPSIRSLFGLCVVSNDQLSVDGGCETEANDFGVEDEDVGRDVVEGPVDSHNPCNIEVALHFKETGILATTSMESNDLKMIMGSLVLE
ncbi:hypothetical protein KI387_032076, partial [Taxus chinensis]